MKSTILTALLFLATLSASAEQKPVSLHDEILQQDTAMFEAFNAHQLEKVAAYFDDDLEFYHDKGGLSGKSQSLAGLKGMFDQNNGMRRDLVPGTLEVYPIKDYGAIEIGAHRFCHQENGKDDCGTFKFLHVWQKKNDAWKITRVVSYDH